MENNKNDQQDKEFSQLFLEESLSEMRASQRIDQQLVVMKSQYRYILYFCGLILAVASLWALFGSIPIKVIAKGIVLNETSLRAVQSYVDGVVESIHVAPRQDVTKGQQIISLKNQAIAITTDHAKENLNRIEEEYKNLVENVNAEKSKRDASLEKKIYVQYEAQDNYKKMIELLKQNLEVQEGLLKKGLINATEVLTTRKTLLETENKLEDTQAELENLFFEFTKTYRVQELEGKEKSLREATEKYALADLNTNYLQIQSDGDYKVVEIQTEKNRWVKRGDILALIEGKFPEENLVFFAYAPDKDAKRIHVGDTAFVQLSNFKEEEYGSLQGIVKAISSYPLSNKGLLLDLESTSLVNMLTQNGESVFRVEILLEKDATTPSGFKWTSGSGPDAKITSGSTGSAKLVVERIRPIYYLIPRWKD